MAIFGQRGKENVPWGRFACRVDSGKAQNGDLRATRQGPEARKGRQDAKPVEFA